MSEIDIIRRIAEQILTIPTPAGTMDKWLWDRAERIVRNIERICQLGEIAGANLPIDMFCLTAAGLLADAGLAARANASPNKASVVAADLSDDEFRDFSAQIVSEKLAGAIDSAKVDKINQIIIQAGSRDGGTTEAMILSDARSLDDMGAVGIFNEFRRYLACGKGLSDVLANWQRKLDYGYWDARLKESFRFDSVRQLARKRYCSMEHFMKALAKEHSADDLEEKIEILK